MLHHTYCIVSVALARNRSLWKESWANSNVVNLRPAEWEHLGRILPDAALPPELKFAEKYISTYVHSCSSTTLAISSGRRHCHLQVLFHMQLQLHGCRTAGHGCSPFQQHAEVLSRFLAARRSMNYVTGRLVSHIGQGASTASQATRQPRCNLMLHHLSHMRPFGISQWVRVPFICSSQASSRGLNISSEAIRIGLQLRLHVALPVAAA